MTRQLPRARKITRTLGGIAVVAVTALAAGGLVLADPTAAVYRDTATAAADTYTAPASYTAVSTQFSETSVALSGGYVWIWGYKAYGMSGNGVENDRDSSPKPVYGLSNVVNVVGASDLSEKYGTFGALTESGEVFTWGSNKLGRLGIGSTTGNKDYRATPQRVEFPGNERVIELGSMRATMAAMTESGKVYTWGSGQYGQAGNGSTSEGKGPHAPYLVMENAHTLHVGQRITWVVTRTNDVFWWGAAIKARTASAPSSITRTRNGCAPWRSTPTGAMVPRSPDSIQRTPAIFRRSRRAGRPGPCSPPTARCTRSAPPIRDRSAGPPGTRRNSVRSTRSPSESRWRGYRRATTTSPRSP